MALATQPCEAAQFAGISTSITGGGPAGGSGGLIRGQTYDLDHIVGLVREKMVSSTSWQRLLTCLEAFLPVWHMSPSALLAIYSSFLKRIRDNAKWLLPLKSGMKRSNRLYGKESHSLPLAAILVNLYRLRRQQLILIKWYSV